ncbi:3-hydroxyacyl-[acyl-carrier-protein] dehydratase [Saccharothrix tamanrassetensis]|uniref:3-hydroxyacyl-[acyl-carrier-protein] dehydratase n=1 Tax=Saccharothrix tamanrassetensis TaxID=1051531 RepID=A0A841CD07_9PSEU|nr:MaoC/PaaZ C-terminal domain-containing protein [Saccharothrix tamanrassetensis]MBB5954058.1 3-hydroxyacyl-[acyl-carrier-protein] dehydratase [Saccharothrix tamanrassetensis]
MTAPLFAVHVDPADPVFAGHYPGFPILPGLFVVEHVRAALREQLPGLRVTALDRAKFLHPVFPGDDLAIETTLTHEEDQVRCVAKVSTAAGPVAEFKLRLGGGGQR